MPRSVFPVDDDRRSTRRGRKPISHAENARRLKLYYEGFSDAEIGRKLGLTRYAIYNWRCVQGLPSNNPNRSKKRPPKRRARPAVLSSGDKMTYIRTQRERDILRRFMSILLRVTEVARAAGCRRLDVGEFIKTYRNLM